MEDNVDDRPPPPPTFKLNEDANADSDLPAWKRAQMAASSQQQGMPAEAGKVAVKAPVIQGFKSTRMLKIPAIKVPGSVPAAVAPNVPDMPVPPAGTEIPVAPAVPESVAPPPAVVPDVPETPVEPSVAVAPEPPAVVPPAAVPPPPPPVSG